MAYTTIDLFAGCGGLTEGFRQEGFSPVFAVEWDRAAAATYAENFGNHIVCRDITEVDEVDIPAADMVIGGPPCQGFSQLGSRDPDDPRNGLWKEYARIVHFVHPKVFVLENVPQFMKSEQFHMMLDWTGPGGPLEDYQLAYGVVNAADFGVPQRRRRVIVVGSRVGVPTLPNPTHGGPGLQPWTTLRQAFSGISFATGPSDLPDRFLESGIPGPFKAPELHL